jgi:hypothetical protein
MGAGNAGIRRVIQHKSSRLYLMESGQWTADLDEAHKLPNVLAAVRLSQTLKLQDTELVFKFEDAKYDLRLDL